MLNYNREAFTASPTPSVTINGKQRRALRKLLRDLVCFAGVAAADLAAAPRKAPQRNRGRLLYRRADTLSDDEVKSIVVALGPERVLRVVDRLTSPELPIADVSEAVGAPMTDDHALSWWHAKQALRGSRNEWWARDGGIGRYVVALCGDHWDVHYHHGVNGCKRRPLGTAATAEEGMALAQAEIDDAWEKIPA